MENNLITVNTFSRMFRAIPRTEKSKCTGSRGFMYHLKSAASTGDKMPDVEQDVDWSIDAVAYRQLIADRIQNMPYNFSNDLDTTMISISDAGIERMMKEPEYETWVLKQIKGLFMRYDPFRGLAGGKMNIIRIEAAEEDLRITTERAGFPNGDESMLPKTQRDEDGFWIRREKRFEEQMDIMEKIQELKDDGIRAVPSEMIGLIGKTPIRDI